MMTADYFKETFHFAPESASPLYVQLAAYIKFQIQAGIFKPGDKMITETDMCEILGVSRTTVRLSMNKLVDEGLIVRYRGKGSFIAEQKLRRNINYMYNFTEHMRELGAKPNSIVMASEVVPATDLVAAKLELPTPNTEVFRLTRLRCANDNPLLLETSYIPYYLCPGIEKNNNFEMMSLYNVLSNQYSLNLYHAVETIEAIIIDKQAAETLQCPKRMPGYKIERISYLDSGYIFEYTNSITRADKCVFKLDLYKNTNSFKSTVEIERKLNA